VFFGHVEQIASSEQAGMLLLRCPRCGWVYETAPRGDATATHLSGPVAPERFVF
jgi:hypothetical protein